MKVYITADHNGFALKNALRDWLLAEGREVQDVGPQQYDAADDYPDFGIRLAHLVAEDPRHRLGIAICGSGVGMAVVADKVKGVRAGLIHDPAIAQAAKRDDDINVLALGARYLSEKQAKDVVRAWLTATFSGEERHVRRINKIAAYER
ncbi:MAG TPA: RpiB/LacA/LacB family sugar-phosphate isomerase [Candidatus Andersenbacteria bacterium]|nr:RpiB/LacA/LacB family sugar-phosphate isomerase [Candidatus Andersenbacteria bacterium]